jgi:hypothetical protein
MQAYLLKTAKRLKKEASWRFTDLKKLCVDLISQISDENEPSPNTDEPSDASTSPPPSFDSADPYFFILKAACETRHARIVDIALDALHYLIEHDFLRGKQIIDAENQLTLMDDIIETVCKCEDDYDEVIQLQVMHACIVEAN